jgi:hypothetical protein
MRINKLLILSFFMLTGYVSYAQKPIINLNLKTKNFNNGSDLLAEKNFDISINTNSNVDYIDIEFYKKLDRDNFYSTVWQRSIGELNSVAILPVNIKLKSGTSYAFKIKSFRNLTLDDKLKIASQISLSSKNFIESSIIRTNKGYEFRMSDERLMENLNGILASGLGNLEVSFGKKTNSYSDILKVMLKNLEETRFKNLMQDSTDLNYKNALNSVSNQVDNELINIINSYSYVLSDIVEIDSYQTEKTMNFLSLNAGYGGVYQSGNYSNVNYFDGFFAGVSFPLSNYALSNSFISKTSFSAGVFFNDFKIDNNSYLTGPIVGRPLYATLGYRFLNFVKISAGTTIVQEENTLLNTTSNLQFKPFIGLGIELDLWLGLKKR